MAGELKHSDPGGVLEKTEYEATTAHTLDGIAAGDILYADGTYIKRLAKGTDGDYLKSGTTPAWGAHEEITTAASDATPNPTGGSLRNLYTLTALAAAAEFAAPSGTPVNGNRLIIRVLDDGTARALTWNAIYRGVSDTLPATTVLSKTLYCGFIYNSAATKWDMVAMAQEP